MKAGRKAVNEFISPNLMTVDLTSDMMVQHDQFSIYFKCRPVLRLLYLLFDFIEEIDNSLLIISILQSPFKCFF